MWIVKLDALGNIIWQKRYGGASNERAGSIEQTSDGGYIVAGYSNSFGGTDYYEWILKLNSLGDLIWQKTVGKTYINAGQSSQSLVKANDGSFVITHFGPEGGLWAIKMDASGNMDPSCTFLNNTFTIPGDTTALPIDSTAVPASAYMLSSNSSVAGIDTSITDTLVCQGSSPGPGAVPDNDNYPGAPLTLRKFGSTDLILL